MRFCVTAGALCVSLTAPAFAVANAPPAPPKTSVSAPAASVPAPPAPAPDDFDAAAKHAKLTECLKQAKMRKLIGPDKTAFIKDCTAKN